MLRGHEGVAKKLLRHFALADVAARTRPTIQSLASVALAAGTGGGTPADSTTGALSDTSAPSNMDPSRNNPNHPAMVVAAAAATGRYIGGHIVVANLGLFLARLVLAAPYVGPG